ncbi:MAG: multiheme c-type cytochrome [Nitrospirota bacterium]|nr:multiheme c-type cytochrome [Nitrospirota bacterium]
MRYILSILLLLTLLTIATTADAGYRDIFGKEFLTKPWAGGLVEESVCIECHTSDIIKPEFRDIPQEWKKSWHYHNDVSCENCHGGDPEDAEMAMSPERGFVGTPKYSEVPEVCGKCHIGILKNYLESGHGKALKASKTGPNCVTCHGSHNIQKASIKIINESRCSKCHSYERAKIMKQALFLTEKKIRDIDNDLKKLKSEGVFTDEEDKSLFRTHVEYRTLFHTVNVDLVKQSTDKFVKKLGLIEEKIDKTFKELEFRKNFSVFLMMVFAGLGIVIFLLSRTYKD